VDLPNRLLFVPTISAQVLNVMGSFQSIGEWAMGQVFGYTLVGDLGGKLDQALEQLPAASNRADKFKCAFLPDSSAMRT